MRQHAEMVNVLPDLDYVMEAMTAQTDQMKPLAHV